MTTSTTKSSSSSSRAAAEAARKQAEAARARQAEAAAKKAAEKPVAELSKPALASLKGESGFDAPATQPSGFKKTTEVEATKESEARMTVGDSRAVSNTSTEKVERTTTWVDGMDEASKATLTEAVSVERGLKVNNDSVTASGKVGGALDFKSSNGWGVSAGAEGSASATTKVTEKDGVTSFELSGEVSASVSGKISAPVGSLSGSETAGASASLSVSMPTEAFKELAKDPSSFNPMDPETYPEGTTVTMSADTFRESELGVAVKSGLLGVSGSSSTKDTSGNVMQIEKLPDGKVRLTEGPTEAFERKDSIGLKLGEVAGASVTGTDTASVVSTRSAEFDLTTEAGREAFNTALLTGEVPTSSAPGVSSPKKIDVASAESSSVGKASLGPYDAVLSLGDNNATRTLVTNEDGTVDAETKLKYSDNPELTIDQRYDAAGNEVARSYSFEVTPDETTAALYNELLTGSKEGPVKAGETTSLTFTDAQLAELQARLTERLDQTPGLRSDWLSRGVDGKVEPLTTEQFAAVIAKSTNDAELATELYAQLVSIPTVAGEPVRPLAADMGA